MRLTFALWNPIIDRDQMGCSFDVTPHLCQLASGTIELMREFLRCLNIEAEPKDWHIEPFCSAYYSSTSMESYQDRHPMAWRVKISFTEPCSENTAVFLTVFKPIGVENADDDTWNEDENSWNWTSMKYVAIADFFHGDWEELDRDFSHEPVFLQCLRIERAELERRMVQVRFYLGLIHFPEEEERVMEFLRACEERDASINWAKTMHGW